MIGVTIDIDQIDYDDKAVLASFGTGKTEGVFQLESAGYENLYERVKTAEFRRCDRGDLFIPSGTYGFYPGYISQRQERAQVRSYMTARS